MLAALALFCRPKTDFMQDDGKIKRPKGHLSPYGPTPISIICIICNDPFFFYYLLDLKAVLQFRVYDEKIYYKRRQNSKQRRYRLLLT